MDIFDQIVDLIPRLPRDPEEAYPPPGVEEWEIRAFEAETGLQVPPDLRRWLAFCNGASFGPGGVSGIRTRDPHDDARRMFERFPNWMEKGWIRVGSDGCGNYYVLATRPEDGPGTPVFFIDNHRDRDAPCYVVASGLFPFLRSYFRSDLGERGWPCDPKHVLADDPALSLYIRHPKCWEADDWAPT